MITITNSASLADRPALLEPIRLRFREGQLVVLDAEQPLVCVVLGETANGLLRLSRATCPEDEFLTPAYDVQHLATWLMSQLAPVEQAATNQASAFTATAGSARAPKEDSR